MFRVLLKHIVRLPRVHQKRGVELGQTSTVVDVQKLVLLQLFPVLSLHRLKSQAAIQKVSALHRDFNLLGDLVGSLRQIALQLLHIIASKGVFSCKHLIKESSKAPNVRLIAVLISVNQLWRHS